MVVRMRFLVLKPHYSELTPGTSLGFHAKPGTSFSGSLLGLVLFQANAAHVFGPHGHFDHNVLLSELVPVFLRNQNHVEYA